MVHKKNGGHFTTFPRVNRVVLPLATFTNCTNIKTSYCAIFLSCFAYLCIWRGPVVRDAEIFITDF